MGYGFTIVQAWLLWNYTKALELMDSCLEDSCVKSEVLRCIQVGLLCVQKFPEDRPDISSAAFMLANKGATLPQPKQPGFFIERSTADTEPLSRQEESHTENVVTITMMVGR
ncbi:hypothetical protein Patl1_04499 [Pistacia atlantica]|uniref:Uncharacterized protein n=1 Tax=Pistacia atlantica TaxID=434234 RepID=A0ACC1BRF1_9ROSI|nr:hypothetical protein Patl1_04499 [Pistacia atlantica]